MKEYSSCFAERIKSMLEFRLSVGMKNVTHECYLKAFDDYCRRYRRRNCELTHDIVFEFIDHEAKRRGNRCHSRYSVMRTFGQYLRAIGVDAYVLPVTMMPQKTKPLPYVFTDEELSAFFRSMDTPPKSKYSPWLLTVLPVMMRLIYTCGLRPGEGMYLPLDHVNLSTGEIKLTETKHNRERIVVMSDDMKAYLENYLAIRNARFAQSGPLFPDERGEEFEPYRIRRIFNDSWRRANPSLKESELPRIRIYDLRHRFASAVLHRWMDEGRHILSMIPYLRAYMGHRIISSTMYYVHLLPERFVSSQGIDWNKLNTIIPED